LGFVSLILLVFKDYVPNLCIKYNPGQLRWTLLDSVDGCPCCLSKTSGITYCGQIYHNCSFDSSTKEPYCGCDLGWPESTYDPAIANGTECTSFRANEEKFVFNTFAGALSTGSNTSDLCEIYSTLYGNGSISNSSNAISSEEGGSPGGRRLFQQLETHGEELVGRNFYRSLLQDEGEEKSESSSPSVDEDTHVIPQIGTFECDGPFYRGACPTGEHPAISDSALEQVHLMLFLVAVVHVLISVLVVVSAIFRMRQWRRWQKEDIEALELEEAKELETVLSLERGDDDGDDEKNDCEIIQKDDDGVSAGEKNNNFIIAENGDGKEETMDEEKGNLGFTPSTSSKTSCISVISPISAAPAITSTACSGSASTTDAEGTTTTTATTITEKKIPTLTEANQLTQVLSNLKSKAQHGHRRWQRRDTTLERPHHFLIEGLICFIQAFQSRFIKHSDFSTMRTAFITSRNLPKDYSFVQEVTLHLDYDLVRIVGASVSMWSILILEKLLDSIASWISSLFLLLSAVALLCINIGLVATIRYSVRGGRPHRVQNVHRWYHGAHWLAIPIGGIIFLCSLTYSNALFYWWQFGADSCYFKPPPGLQWVWLPAGTPWWARVIAPAVMLHWIASVTVPTWAMVMHMRPRVEDDSVVKNAASLHGGGAAAAGGSEEVEGDGQGGSSGGERIKKNSSLLVGGVGTEKEYTSQAEVLSDINKLQALLSSLQN
jgi:Mlo family